MLRCEPEKARFRRFEILQAFVVKARRSRLGHGNSPRKSLFRRSDLDGHAPAGRGHGGSANPRWRASSMPPSCSMTGWSRRSPITWRASWAARILSPLAIREMFDDAVAADPGIGAGGARRSVGGVRTRSGLPFLSSRPFSIYKGFHALESYRIAHWLWQRRPQSDGAVLAEPHLTAVRGGHSSRRRNRDAAS